MTKQSFRLGLRSTKISDRKQSTRLPGLTNTEKNKKPGRAKAPAASKDGGVHIARIKVDIAEKAKRFKVYIDRKNVPNWNGIDAIGLISDEGKQWVSWAEASSCCALGECPGNARRAILGLLEPAIQEEVTGD